MGKKLKYRSANIDWYYKGKCNPTALKKKKKTE